MHRNAFFALTLLSAVIVFEAFPAAAQVTTAAVSGHVSDPKDLAVANAKVVVTNKETGLSRETTTSDLGDFSISLLPPGSYKVTITAAGFFTSVLHTLQPSLR